MRPRILDPTERWAEILFGLIMVLTFTSSISAGESGREDVRTMLIGALGCNLAWGLVDAIMYLLNTLGLRGRGIVILRRLRRGSQPSEARRMIGDALPPVVTQVIRDEELDTLRERLVALPEPPKRASFTRQDFLGALGIFLLVFLSTFPVVIPFFFVKEAHLALRLSNAVAIVMLFLGGFSLAKYSGFSPWRTGVVMVAIGLVLVAITIALGG
ncbi:MAG TPA: VIT1/CCC1 transporter family protein [Thermoanaerobaculia bacterium]|nr:VIT1/CCC1 transporter family protein [Thermoanaerobaculia bacterium]